MAKPSTVIEAAEAVSSDAVRRPAQTCCRYSAEAGEDLGRATTKISRHLRWRGSGKIRKSNSRMAQPNSASMTAGMMVK